MKLNLGCKEHKFKGWVNIDINPDVTPDLVHDVLKELPYEDGSVEEIYAGHLVEHIHYKDLEGVLGDWYRVLKEGGKLTVAFPDYTTAMLMSAQGELSPFELSDILIADGAHRQFMSGGLFAEFARGIGFREVRKLEDSEYLSGRAKWQTILEVIK